ncbi:sortase [Candidatus Woesebacteria bacterium]|nr:sortase [Candidatus Woesebacteria bacterium]
MYPKRTIYQQGKSDLSGETILAPSFFGRLVYTLARGIGAGLIGFTIIGIIFTYGPIIKEEIYYAILGQQNRVETSSFGQILEFAEAEKTKRVKEEAESFGVNSYFSIVIPKINAASNITANVDASNEKEYLEALKEGVAHAKGTYFPGQGNQIFLFAHSTDSSINVAKYNAVFYLLRKLEVGDRLIVFFADRKYEYEVEKKITISAKDTSWFTDSEGGERLILQTCDPPGTTWKRLLVITKPASF